MLVAVVQLLSHIQLFATPWTAAHQASLSFTIFWSLLKLMSIELVMWFNHLILCCPLFLLPSIFPSTRVFSSELALCIRWPQYWSFNFSTSPSNEYSGLITFRINWHDLLAVQGALKSLLQHHHSKAISSLVLSLLYGPTLISFRDYWKNHILTIWTFVGKVMSLSFVFLNENILGSYEWELSKGKKLIKNQYKQNWIKSVKY